MLIRFLLLCKYKGCSEFFKWNMQRFMLQFERIMNADDEKTYFVTTIQSVTKIQELVIRSKEEIYHE